MANYRVLIVENQRKDRQALRAGIESLGQDFKIVDASSGEEALLLLSRQPVDLLVSELRLAGISGLELMQKVRQRYPDVKTIFVAGARDTSVQQQVITAGAQAFFLKPLDMAALLGAVRSSLALPAAAPAAEPAPAAVESPSVPTLSSSLERLRRELDAFSVLLVDENGVITTQAGGLPTTPGGSSVYTALPTLIGAATRLSQSIGKLPPQDLMCFSGEQYDVYLTHAGQSQTLVALTRPEAGIQRLEKILHILLAAANALAQDLINSQMAETPTSETPSTPKRQTDGLATGRLGALLSQAPETEARAKEVDSFWETAAEQAYHEGLPRAGSLSYEQARKLGLAPEEQDQP